MLNIKVFYAMLKELRIKLDINMMGLGPAKTKRVINQGLSSHDKRSRQFRSERIEQIVLKEFNMINISRIKEALQEVKGE